MKRIVLVGAFAALWATPSLADWTLDNDASRISFVSTKAGAAAEVHRFDRLSGTVDDDGNVTISIYLDSVNTAIPIRDERMRTMLFETDEYPSATLVATVDVAAINGLAVGGNQAMTVEAQLAVHGATISLAAELQVAKLSAERILVASQKPLIVNAPQVNLAEGVERLREVAGLPTISPAVPVTFVLAFDD